jgi:hypoxanthine phosphoribosyltransferase
MKTIKILDKNFRESITAREIQIRIEQLAKQINQDFSGKEVDFLVVLNGAFMFAAELLKKIHLNCRVLFLRLSSYEGTASSGNVKQIIGLNESIANKNVVILEDIIDSGNTINSLIDRISTQNATEIRIASLLFKPGSYLKQNKIHYIGFEIPNDFIVGYGLDYDGFGRNLESIYTIINE